MNIPDYVVGLGGAGRKMAKSFITQDWVMEKAVNQGDGNSSNSKVYFIDSDADAELSGDVDDVHEVRDRVFGDGYNPGVDADAIHLVNDAREKPDDGALLFSGNLERMTEAGEIKCWWLENHEDIVRRGFTDGVIRRRGLSKALFHYNKIDDNKPINKLNPSPGNAAITVGLGGGTGSGLIFEIAKELQNNDVSPTLFAVIPGPSNVDTDHELANGYAAMVELELLALKSDNPFKSIVVIPEEPVSNYRFFDRAVAYTIAGYYNGDPAQGNIAMRTDENVEGRPPFAPFTFAVPQVLTYPGGQIDTKREDFDSFVDKRIDMLETEKSLLINAESLIEQYYEDSTRGLLNNPGEVEARLDQELIGRDGLYEGRFKSLEELLESDFMKQAGYRTEEGGRESMTDDWLDTAGQYDDNSHREMAKKLKDLATHYDSDNTYQHKDAIERKLNDLIWLETIVIGRRTALLETIKQLPDSAVTEELNMALSYSKGSAVSNANGFNSLLVNFNDDTEESEVKQIEEISSDARKAHESFLESWRDAVLPDDGTQLEGFDDLVVETAKLLKSLDEHLKQFKNSARHWNAPADVEDTRLEFREPELDKLDRNLQKLGIDPINGRSNRITDSVDAVKDAGREALKQGGFLRDGPDRGAYNRHKSDVDSDVYTLPDFDIAADSERRFKVEYLSQLITVKREEILEALKTGIPDSDDIVASQRELFSRTDEVVTGFESRLDDLERSLAGDVSEDNGNSELSALGIDRQRAPSPIDRAEHEFDTKAFEEEIKRVIDTIESDLKIGFDSQQTTLPSELAGTLDSHLTKALVTPIEETEDSFSTFREDLDQCGSMTSALDGVASDGNSFYKSWDGTISEVEIFSEVSEAGNDDGAYFTQITPDDNARLDKKSIAESGIWGDEREQARLMNAFYERFHEVLDDRDYLPFVETNIRPNKGGAYTEKRNYNDHLLTVAYLSKVFDEENGIDRPQDMDRFEVSPDFENRQAVPLTADEASVAAIPYADDWDFAGVAFISGVFLDNIDPVRTSYKSKYDAVTGQKVKIEGRVDLENPYLDSSVMRHTLGIDGMTDDAPEGADGVFYRRKKFIQFGRDDSLANLLDVKPGDIEGKSHDNHWDRARDNLYQNFVERVGMMSTRQLPKSDE